MIRKDFVTRPPAGERVLGARTRWHAVLGIVMVLSGCACFVLSCVAAMRLGGKD